MDVGSCRAVVDVYDAVGVAGVVSIEGDDIQLTVVVIVSPPVAIHAGWKTLPILFDCASVNATVPGSWMQSPLGWLPGVGVGYS